MASPEPLPQGGETATGIAPGTLVGGRFMIERHVGTDALGDTLLARDQKTNKPIAVRILAPALAGNAAAYDAIRAEIRTAAKLKHRSLAGTYGIGTHASRYFVAYEWVQGDPLAVLIAKRKETDTPLSVRGAYNVIAHVCKALGQVHTATCHGALRPSVVFITKSGRVKVGELGLGMALGSTGQWAALDPSAQAFLAPEVRAAGKASRSSDVFGVGALLYALLSGRSLHEPFVAPSQLRADVGPELDAVVAKCLEAEPSARYATVEEIAHALMPLVAGTPEPDRLELGVDLEIDVDVAMSMAPPAPAPSAPRAAPRPSPPGMPALRDPRAAAKAPAPPAAVRPKPAAADLSTLMAKLTENDAPRWIAVKNGLDHGPFTARELIKVIVEGDVLEQHVLLNMSTSESKPLGQWPEFGEFVEQYKLRKAEADHAVALEKSTRIERTSNAAKFVILGGSIALVLVVGGGYLMSRQAAQRRQAQREVDLAAMFESGRVKITGSAGILQAPPHKAGVKHTSSGSGERSTGFTSYDDAMNTAIDMDLNKAGGERQLRTEDIEAVMNRRLNSLFGCVSQELRGGGHLGTVRIDLAILGSGRVMGASINNGSPGFKRCIAAKVRQIGFPTFPAPRMGARYSFGVD